MPFDATGPAKITPTPVVENDAQRIIRDACELMERVGRTTVVSENLKGNVCLLGAMHKVAGSRSAYFVERGSAHSSAVKAVAQAARELFPRKVGEFGRDVDVCWQFNDNCVLLRPVRHVLYRAYVIAGPRPTLSPQEGQS